MTKTRPFLSMCYGDPSATEVPPCCETATKKLTFSTTSVLLLLNMPLSLSRATIFRRQKNPRRVYRPKIAGILFVCNEPEGKYYTVPINGTAPRYLADMLKRQCALGWVYTSDAVWRRMRRHTMRLARRFAALDGAVLQASTCASVLVKSINARGAYKAWQKLSDFLNTV